MRLLIPILLLPLVPAAVGGECLLVEGPYVEARDLSTKLPAFASLPPSHRLFPAPRPGVRRFLQPAELRRLAIALGIETGSANKLCLERESSSLRPEEVHAAILKAWEELGGASDTPIELLDYSRGPVPKGELRFGNWPAQNHADCELHSPISVRGRLVYDKGQSIPIWASVRVPVNKELLVFSRDLATGSVIVAEDLEETRTACFPPPAGQIENPESAVGRKLRASVKRGQPVRAQQLTQVRDVDRGDLVFVLIPGLESVQVQVRALTSGRRGESVILVNPLNQKRFQARVEGRRRAVISEEKN